jgi:NMD protein affecting ribosome stability and mRNA decay
MHTRPCIRCGVIVTSPISTVCEACSRDYKPDATVVEKFSPLDTQANCADCGGPRTDLHDRLCVSCRHHSDTEHKERVRQILAEG